MLAASERDHQLFTVVETLTNLLGPSGHEDRVQDWLEARWAAAGCATQRSRIGNLTAFVGGSGPKLLVAAHSDEISFLVKNIDANGHLLLTSNTLGSELTLPGIGAIAQSYFVMLANGNDVPGVIGTVTGHIMSRGQREKSIVDWSDIFLDIGARSRDEAIGWGVEIGNPVVAGTQTRRVGRNLVGKAMDDRAALAIMTAWIEGLDTSLLTYELWLASTVQEEIGLVGSDSMAGFDLAIAMEVGLAGDIPPVDANYLPASLGRGPIIGHKDALVHYDARLTSALKNVAHEAGIPIQPLVFPQFSSDGRRFMGNDIPTALLAFPTRYTHTPSETVDERDLAQLMQLLDAFAKTPPR